LSLYSYSIAGRDGGGYKEDDNDDVESRDTRE